MKEMAPCGKCKKVIRAKQNLNCSKCKSTFHIACTSVSQQRYNSFYALNKAQKSKWICDFCKDSQKSNSTLSSSTSRIMVDSPRDTPLENVTNQKKIVVNISTENSFQSLSTDDEKENGDNSSMLNRSCPVLGRNQAETLAEMQKALSDLQFKLEVAENEISNLLQENSRLKKQLGDNEQKIENLSRICRSIPKKTPNKKDGLFKEMTSTPKHKTHQKGFSVSTSPPANIIDKQRLKTNEVKEKLSSSCKERQPRIFIHGDQQVRGLSEKLNKSRSGKWNDTYKALGLVKPYASSCHVLHNLDTFNSICDEDILVISTGCYDKNPYTLYSNLCNTLHTLRNCKKIFLLSIPFNSHLDVQALNSDLQMLANNYTNCKFIDIDSLQYSFKKRLDLIAYKLNIETDFIKYECDYLQNVLQLDRPIEQAENSQFFRIKK